MDIVAIFRLLLLYACCLLQPLLRYLHRNDKFEFVWQFGRLICRIRLNRQCFCMLVYTKGKCFDGGKWQLEIERVHHRANNKQINRWNNGKNKPQIAIRNHR